MAFWKSRNAAPIQSHHFLVEFNYGGDATPEHFTVKSCAMPSAELSVGEYQLGNHIFKYPGAHKWGDVTVTFVDDKNTTRRLLAMFNQQGWLNPGNRNDNVEVPKKNEEGEINSNQSFDPNEDGTADATNAFANPLVQSSAQENKNKAGESLFELSYLSPPGKAHRKKTIRNITIKQFATVSAFAQLGEEPGPSFFGLPVPTNEQGQGTLFGLPMTNAGDYGGPPMGQIAANIVIQEWSLQNPFIKSINFGTHDYSSDELITIEVVFSYDFIKCVGNTDKLAGNILT